MHAGLIKMYLAKSTLELPFVFLNKDHTSGHLIKASCAELFSPLFTEELLKSPILFSKGKITSSVWFLLPSSTVPDTGLPPKRCPQLSSLKLRRAVNSAFMSLSGQSVLHNFKRAHRRRRRDEAH